MVCPLGQTGIKERTGNGNGNDNDRSKSSPALLFQRRAH